MSFCFSAVACGEVANTYAPPYTTDTATRPFLQRGFQVGCPNLFMRKGIVEDLGIALHASATACEPSAIGTLTVYRSEVDAKRACAPSSKDFCVKFVYRVRNLVLGIDEGDSQAIRHRLLDALRTRGVPIRIA